MSFKNFCNTTESKKTNNVDNSKNGFCNSNFTSDNNSNINESAQEKYEKYSKLSKDELMEEYIKQSKLVKDKGGYSPEQIALIKNTLFPHLNEEQKKYFDTLIGMVK